MPKKKEWILAGYTYYLEIGSACISFLALGKVVLPSKDKRDWRDSIVISPGNLVRFGITK